MGGKGTKLNKCLCKAHVSGVAVVVWLFISEGLKKSYKACLIKVGSCNLRAVGLLKNSALLCLLYYITEGLAWGAKSILHLV